jgi:nucleosome binding factor SPN SPT16 subunit
MVDVNINAEKFFQRLERLQTHWTTHKSTVWGGSDALCIPLGAASGKDMSYSKSSSMHLYLLGYEFPDSIIIITRNSFHFMATAKKCSYLEAALLGTSSAVSINFLKKEKDEGVNRENFHNLLAVIRKGGGKRLGSLFNAEYDGNFIQTWMELVQQSQIEMFEIAAGLGLFFASKDEGELVRTNAVNLFSDACIILDILICTPFILNFRLPIFIGT